MMLPTLTVGSTHMPPHKQPSTASTIEKLHCQGHQRHMSDVYQPKFDTQSSYWLVVPGLVQAWVVQ